MRKKFLLSKFLVLLILITGSVGVASAQIAKIGDNSYSTFADALTAANGMTGDVTVEIYEKVEYADATPNLTGAYDKISFVGKTDNAEISITRNGQNGYISGGVNDCNVSFTDLILSKPAGYYANDAGNMNNAFTVYRVGSVSYTKCSFPNGACAAGCPTSYIECTFEKSHDKYAVWAYGSSDINIDECEFDDDRGIKMYAEGAAKTTAVTVTNCDFSKLTGKPAIVATLGKSITLSGNTYSAKGVLELEDNGSSNGIEITSTDAVTCISDAYPNGCGVLVNNKIYRTVTEAASAATPGSTVTLLHNSTETVTLPVGVTLDNNGYTAEGVTEAAPVEVATYDELVAALANGGKITLTADITVDTKITAKDGTVIDLNDKTLYVNVENSCYNNVTIKNGNIVLGKDDVHVCDGYFEVNAGKTLELNDVNVSSSAEGIKGYAVFHLKTGANLDLINSTLNIADNEYAAGYIVYAGEATATVDVVGTTITGSKVNGIVHATTVIDESTVTLTNVIEHGINRSGVTIDDSNVTISGGTGRGITAQHGPLNITGNSVVSISEMGEATIELRNNQNLTVAETATVTVDAAVNNTTLGTITGNVTVDAGVGKVAKVGDTYYKSLQEAINAIKDMDGEVNITLLADATLDITAWQTLAIGGENTTKITIDGDNGDNDFTLTFNKLNSDWNNVATKNATLVLKNMTITDSGYNNGPWNRYDLNFACNTELVNVNATKALAFKAGAILNNVTINETGDNYAIWIQPNGQVIAIDELVIESAGRGIKIDDQYVDNPALVNLEIKNAKFTTAKKSAILVKSPTGANITAENVNIEEVAADKNNLVWVDSDGAANYGNVTVTGGTIAQEDAEEFKVAIKDNNDNVKGYYKSLQAALNAAVNGDVVTLLADNAENVTVTQKPDVKFTIDGADKTMTGTITIDGKSAAYATAGITVKNMNFTAATEAVCINLGVSGNNNTRYTSNVTVERCNFTGTDKTAVGIKSYTGGDKNLIVNDCIATGMHSLMQLKNTAGVSVTECEITDSKNGISLGASSGVAIYGTTVDCDGYGVRADANGDNGNGNATTITDCTIEAFIPVVVRNASNNYGLQFDGENTMTATNEDGLWCAIGTSEYGTNGTMPTAPTGDVTVTLNDTGLSMDGVYGEHFALNGEGTAESPYLINNLYELKGFRDQVNDQVNAGINYAGKYVKLAADIDLNNEEWTPIGNDPNKFQGYFDGNNKTISNLKVTGNTSHKGFFGYIKGTGMSATTTPSVKDLTLDGVNVNVEGDGNYVGGLAGQAFTCNITNVTVKGNVSGVRYVGGLVGHVYTYFKDCHFIGNASCSFDALGGIAGAGDCRAYDCSVIGDITGSNWVGGIVGNGQEGTSAVGCYVKGDVKTATNWYFGVGGIAGVAGHGYSSSEFKNNYFDGEVYLEGEKVPAMIIGIVNAENNETINATIEGNSWNTEHYDAETPVYVTAESPQDGTTEDWIARASEELTKPRNNNLVMLESDIQYVDATDIEDVTIMIFSEVTEDDILPQIEENNQVAYIDSNADGAYNEGETKYTSLADAYIAATDGQTITLLKNITLGEKFVIAKSITLDGNDKTLTYTGTDRAIDVPNDANANIDVTVKNLTVVATTANRGLNYNENGEFNVEGVTVTIGENVDGYAINFPGMADDAQVTIKDSKLTSRNPLNIWGENMTINVYDSEIISVDNSTTYDYAAIQLNNDNYGNVANGTVVNVYGGKITALNDNDEPSNVVANATETGVVNISDETIVTGKVLNYVANIGGVYFGSLQAAVNAIEKYGYNSPIVIMKSFATSETATVKNGLNVTIDLNGKTITVTDNTTKNFEAIKNQGTLTIKDSSADKTGKITVTATTNSGWNRYSAVIANTVGGKLTVDGGTLEHLGGTDMAYAIDNLTNGQGTYAETIINGGTMKSPYRAIRQFLNGIEAQNILTVNGGTIEGTNKSIWMQDPSAKANTGTLTVGENASLKGDVYLSVTEGSTEWPVEVSIDAEALQGESTVMTNGNVPAGYELQQDANGNYVVNQGVAKIGEVLYATVTEAINAAENGGTVQLLALTIDEYVAPWATDTQHTSEKSITIIGAENFGTTMTGGLYLGYDNSQCREHTIVVKGINFTGKGILVASQQNVTVEGNKFTDITDHVASSSSAGKNAISIIGNDVIATVKNNVITTTASVGIDLRNILTAIVDGNTVTGTQHNSMQIQNASANSSAEIANNRFFDWGKSGEGRAMRINQIVTADVNNNVMINVNAPEEFVKITEHTTAKIDENYWNGANPTSSNTPAYFLAEGVQVHNYYAAYDEESNTLIDLLTIEGAGETFEKFYTAAGVETTSDNAAYSLMFTVTDYANNEVSVKIGSKNPDENKGCDLLIPSSVKFNDQDFAVTSIPVDGFKQCKGFDKLVVPGTITSVSDSAFYNCSKLTEVVIKEGVQKLGKNTFYKISNLQTLTLPSTLKRIESLCFNGTHNIETIVCNAQTPPTAFNASFTDAVHKNALLYVDGKYEDYKAANGWSNFKNILAVGATQTIDKDRYTLIATITDVWNRTCSVQIGTAPTNTKRAELAIPEHVSFSGIEFDITSIPESGFRDCKYFEGTLTIPAYITSIGGYAFEGCSAVTALVVDEGVTSLGTGNTFNGCRIIETITLPSTLTKIPSGCFNNIHEKLQVVECHALVPPTASQFTEAAYKNATLYVHDVDAYKEANNWKRFKSIRLIGAVAQNKETEVEYKSIAEAIAAATSGQTITLLADVEAADGNPVLIPEGVTLDINTHNVTANIYGTVKTSGGLWTTVTVPGFNSREMLGDGAIYNTNNATVANSANEVNMLAGSIVLNPNPETEWWTLPYQNLSIASGASFEVPANIKFTVRENTHVVVDGTLTVNGVVYLQMGATVEAAAGLNILTDVEGYMVSYEDGVYSVVQTIFTQTTQLNAGWNWFSYYVNTDLETLENELGESGIQIKSHSTGLFVKQDEEGDWYGSLETISPTEMYTINTSTNVTMEFIGEYVNPTTPIAIKYNWNAIGYMLNIPLSLDEALKTLNPQDGDYIKSKEGFAKFEDGEWEGSLETLNPGEGYMLKSVVTTERTLIYSSTRGTNVETKANITTDGNYWTPNASQYPNNMTMTAMVDIEGGDYEVAAFVDGEVRGSARPIYVESIDAYVLFLTIHGEGVDEMTFKFYDLTTGEEFDLNDRMNYSDDAIVGSLKEPYMFNRGTTGIGEAAMSEVNIYPNPTTTGTEINLQATCDKVEVFNALGVKVAEYQNVDSIDAIETAGIYVIRITNDSNVQNCRLVVK